MKQIMYLSFLTFIALTFCCSKTEAQYHITSNNWLTVVDSGGLCSPPQIEVRVNTFTAGLSVAAYFGDGTSSTTSIVNGGGYGFAYIYHSYAFPGTYTIKYVLYSGSAPIDSAITKHEYLYCSTFILNAFNDVLGTGIFNSSIDNFFTLPFKVQVSKNGAILDTVMMTSGLYYNFSSPTSEIYSFKVIDYLAGLTLTTPSSGIVNDTVQTVSNNYTTRYFGFKCSGSTTSFDLSVNPAIPVTGIHDQCGDIYVHNTTCDPVSATVTLYFSPKYNFHGNAYPAPSSYSGNYIEWNLPGVSFTNPIDLFYAVSDDGGLLAAGDTVHEHIEVTPTTGDSNPANNIAIVIDTVRAGCDPNEMSVAPVGTITAGTQLQYTINFQNTGNDTAFNISVYDTLSGNVDVKSLNIVTASAVMNIAVLNYGGHNIVKFDFPNINLLDSTHHGFSTGAVIFTVNSFSGLTVGKTIFNHAGIFFDYNPVVMTDTVENIIGMPNRVVPLNTTSKVTMYPNPVTNVLTINTEPGAYSTMSICNILGQVVVNQVLDATQANVNVKGLPSGIYYVTLRGDTGVKEMRFEKL